MAVERVLVVPADRLAAAGAFVGFRPADDAYLAALLDPAHLEFRPRPEMESDPSFKQLIPYVVLRHGDRLFHYRRRAGGERRLDALRSVGVGGHVCDADGPPGADVYRAGMLRELAEEVRTAPVVADQLFGFIYDDTSPVGRVHLGVVHLWELAAPDAVPLEPSLAEAGFASLAELHAERRHFETWSQLVLEQLVGTPT